MINSLTDKIPDSVMYMGQSCPVLGAQEFRTSPLSREMVRHFRLDVPEVGEVFALVTECEPGLRSKHKSA